MTLPAAQLTALYHALNTLAPLSEEAWSFATSKFKQKQFRAGEHVIQAGDTVSDLYFMATGLARYYYLDQQGKEFNKSFAVPGQVLSSISSLAAGEPSPFYIQAMSVTDCFTLPYKQLLELSETYDEWTRIRITMLEQLLIMKERREADFLLLSATERYKKFISQYAHIASQIPNYHIASYLGITEVALSRIRGRLGLTVVNDTEGA